MPDPASPDGGGGDPSTFGDPRSQTISGNPSGDASVFPRPVGSPDGSGIASPDLAESGPGERGRSRAGICPDAEAAAAPVGEGGQGSAAGSGGSDSGSADHSRGPSSEIASSHLPGSGGGGQGDLPGAGDGQGAGGLVRSRDETQGILADLEGSYIVPGVVTTGDYRWHVQDLGLMLAEINDVTHVRVTMGEKYVVLGRDPIRNAPLIIFTGHDAFKLTRGEQAALRQFVANGGTIWADYSHMEFDASFRSAMIKTFGKAPSTIPMGSIIYNAFFRMDAIPAGDYGDHQLFEGIEAPDGNRYAVVITPNRYFAAMDGPPHVPARVQRQALQVSTNIFMYAARNYQRQANGL
jgi:hypothetical protein